VPKLSRLPPAERPANGPVSGVKLRYESGVKKSGTKESGTKKSGTKKRQPNVMAAEPRSSRRSSLHDSEP
jgi:hypothetical protein